MRNVTSFHSGEKYHGGVRQLPNVIAEQQVLDTTVDQILVEARCLAEQLTRDGHVAASQLIETPRRLPGTLPYAEFRARVGAASKMIVSDVNAQYRARPEGAERVDGRIEIARGNRDIGIQKHKNITVCQPGAGVLGAADTVVLLA